MRVSTLQLQRATTLRFWPDLSLELTMDLTEPPSLPLLPHDEADVHVSDDEGGGTSASTTASTSLAQRSDGLERPKTRSEHVGRFPAPLIAFFVVFPRYFNAS
jgi:hypothetical protein